MLKSLEGKFLAVSALALGVAFSAQAETVRLSSHGGSDPAVIHGLLNDVLADEIAALGIDVEYAPNEGDYSQFILNALSAGTAPDVFYTDIFWSRSIFGPGQAAAVDNSDISDALLPSLVDAFTYEGNLLAVAKDFNTLAVHYDKDVFDDAGVAYPDEGDSWEVFQEKLSTVQAAFDDVYGVCVVPDYARFAAFALGTGWRPFNEEGKTVLDDNFRRAFAFYTGLIENGAGVLAADIGEGWTGGCLGSGKAAVAMEGAWIIGYLKDAAPNMEYGTTLIPVDAETGERGNLIFTVGWTVRADSEVKDAAHQLVELLTGEKAQQWVLEQGLALPSRSSLVNNAYLEGDSKEQKANRMVFRGASEGNVMPYFFGDLGGAWLEPINSALNSVMLGEADVDTAISEAQARLDVLMAD
ncbi:MAG: ABC transporter substrate-binding protein [Desulfuromonadales bacterium C00003068]|nr:MAG: ABC transporter substrate-binding protein [Desulfuromonadales bacterium C00003068]